MKRALLLLAAVLPLALAKMPAEVAPVTLEEVYAIQGKVNQVGNYLRSHYAPFGVGVDAYMKPVRHVELMELQTVLYLTPQEVATVLGWENRFVVYRLVNKSGEVSKTEYIGIRFRERDAG